MFHQNLTPKALPEAAAVPVPVSGLFAPMEQRGVTRTVNAQSVGAFDLWFPKQAHQRVLWPSPVRLSEEFFQSLGRHAVPPDARAVTRTEATPPGAEMTGGLETEAYQARGRELGIGHCPFKPADPNLLRSLRGACS